MDAISFLCELNTEYKIACCDLQKSDKVAIPIKLNKARRKEQAC